GELLWFGAVGTSSFSLAALPVFVGAGMLIGALGIASDLAFRQSTATELVLLALLHLVFFQPGQGDWSVFLRYSSVWIVVVGVTTLLSVYEATSARKRYGQKSDDSLVAALATVIGYIGSVYILEFIGGRLGNAFSGKPGLWLGEVLGTLGGGMLLLYNLRGGRQGSGHEQKPG